MFAVVPPERQVGEFHRLSLNQFSSDLLELTQQTCNGRISVVRFEALLVADSISLTR